MRSHIRRFMKDLGWTETRLAKEAKLSQSMVNAFLNGKRKLSAPASDRINAALEVGFRVKKQAAEAFKYAAPDIDPADPLFNVKSLFAMQADWANHAYGDIWHTPEKLRAEHARNAELETELATLRKLNAVQEEIISAQKEVIRAAVRAGDGDCAVLMSVVRCRLIDNLDRLSDVDAGPGVVRTGALPSVDT
jgi:transcriptional regulator with XRE-family HTH domain